jgi:glyoxylase-like metal-dependent hydrolase (beta-lactamase superfamily II)
LLVGVLDVIFRAVTTDRLFAWHPLTPRVWLVGGNGGNSVVIADGRDVLLVDTKETGFGGALRREVEHVVRHPVTCVVSTHHHTDHVMGNAAFTADVPVIAQRRARERTVARVARAIVEVVGAAERGEDPFAAHVADLQDWAIYYDGHVRLDDAVRTEFESLVQEGSEAVRGIAGAAERTAAVASIAERFAPTESFEREHELRVGGTEVQLHHRGPGHTDGDVVLVVPSEGIVVAADLVYVGLHPFIDIDAGSRTDEWIRRLDELLELCRGLETGDREVVVAPGHGAAAGPEAVASQRTYFERLRETVEEATLAGRSPAEAIRMVPPGLPAERAQLLAVNLGIVLDELAQKRDG